MQLSDVLYEMMAKNSAAGQPTELCIGTVISAEPLEISISPEMPPLKAPVLYLTETVRDYYVDIEIDTYTENDGFMNGRHTHGITDTYTGGGASDSGNLDTTHRHAIKGRKKLLIYSGLQAWEKVLLLRVLHGQRFVVLSRLLEEDSK